MWGRDLRSDLEMTARFPRIKDLPVFKHLQGEPYGTSVDGEFITDSAVCSDVITALKDPKLPLKFVPFGLPFFRGEDMCGVGLADHRDMLVNMLGPGNFAEFFRMTDLIRPTDSWEDQRAQLLAMRGDTEGWVLKQGAAGGRWYKVKPTLTADCVVTDVVPAEPGKFEGQVGSLCLSVHDDKGKLIEVASASGMDDATRRYWTTLWKSSQLTKARMVVEVEYQYVGSNGRLVHPRYMRERPDKPATECTMEQLKQ